MKRRAVLLIAGFLLVVGYASSTLAEVKSVQMKIAGYLCGN